MLIFIISFIGVILTFMHPPIFIIYIVFILIFLIKKKYKLLISLLIGVLFGCVSSIDLIKYDDKKDEYIGIIYERKENYFLLSSEFNNYYIYLENHDYEVFDIVKIQGDSEKLSFSYYEGEFDMENYLYNKKVERQINIKSISFIFKNPLRKNILIDNLLKDYNEETKKILYPYLFNVNYDSVYVDNIFQLNIGHLLSISGIQMYFIFNIINKLALYFFNDKKKSNILSMIMLFPMLIFSNYKLSFLKNYVYLFISKIIDEKLDKTNFNIIFLSGILLVNYRYIFTNSFIYIFLLPIGGNMINISLDTINKKHLKLAKNYLYYLLISIINIFIDNCYNLLGLVYNFVFEIFSKIILILFIVSIVFFSPNILNYFSIFFNNVINFFLSIPSVRYTLDVNLFFLLIFIIVYILTLYFQEVMLFKISLLLNALNYFILFLLTSPVLNINDQYIHFINVGQGDCTLIRNKDYVVLIDTGGSIYKDLAKDVLIPYLKKLHIDKIDTVFITHDDMDHNGALESLMYNFNVYEIIEGSYFTSVTRGDILFNNLNTYNVGYEDNDNSSILYFDFLNKKFLLMGDASKSIENKLMNDYLSIDVDVLKVGHHGSSTSSSYKFLSYISPQEAVISVGRNNKYGHPSKYVIAYLDSLDIIIRRTDMEGTIKYY